MKLNWDCFNDVLLTIENLTMPEFINNEWQYHIVKWQDVVNALKDKYDPVDIINSLIKLKNSGFITTIGNDSDKDKIIRFDVKEVTYEGCLYIENNIEKH